MDNKNPSDNNPWTPFYSRMSDELATNEVEKQIFRMLREGTSLHECESYMVENGFIKDDFWALYEKAGKWENENCSKK